MRSAGFRPERRVVFVLVGVLILHLALIAALTRSRVAQRQAAPTPRVTLRLIPTALPPTPVPRTDAAPAQPTPRTAAAARPRGVAPTVTRDALGAPPATDTAAITPPEPSASAPNALPSLMDTEATRRAIRASAHAPSLGDQLAQSREEPRRASPSDRLAAGVHEAGKGDCMKGEYAGAGMGLLSLPFLAAAALGGNCAK